MGVGHTRIVIQLLYAVISASRQLFISISLENVQDVIVFLFLCYCEPVCFPRSSGRVSAVHRFPLGSVAGKRSLEAAAGDAAAAAAAAAAFRSVETRDARGGGGGIRGPTTEHSAPKMNSSELRSLLMNHCE